MKTRLRDTSKNRREPSKAQKHRAQNPRQYEKQRSHSIAQQGFRGALRQLLKNRRGVASLELALLAPVFLILMLSLVEVYQFFRTAAIIDRTTYSIGNLIAQQTVIIDSNTATNSSDIGLYWTLAPMIATPLDLTDNGSVIVTDVDDGGTNQPAIAWTRHSPSGTGDSTQLSSKQPLPSGFPFYAGDETIVVEVFYHFSPFKALLSFWPGAPNKIVLYRRMYFHPRYQSLATLQSS